MDINIVINKRIYKQYKDDILPLSARLFCDPYFYEINNYNIPFDLKGIENYLRFTDKVKLYTTSTFLDFVNILLVLSFLKEKQYDKKVLINYHILNATSLEKSLFISLSLKKDDYQNVDELLDAIKENKEMKNNGLKLPGLINFINFYNLLVNQNKFMLYFQEVIEENEEDEEKIAQYLYDKYSNMDLCKQFYLDYLKKIL